MMMMTAALLENWQEAPAVVEVEIDYYYCKYSCAVSIKIRVGMIHL